MKKDRVVKRTLYRGSVIGKLPVEKYYEACHYPLLIKIARFLQGISIHNHPKLKVFLFASLNKVCTTPNYLETLKKNNDQIFILSPCLALEKYHQAYLLVCGEVQLW